MDLFMALVLDFHMHLCTSSARLIPLLLPPTYQLTLQSQYGIPLPLRKLTGKNKIDSTSDENTRHELGQICNGL